MFRGITTMKKLTDIISKPFSSLKKAALIPAAALAMYVTPVSGQTVFNFSADRSGTVQNPAYGLSQTDSDFFLSDQNFTRTLPLNFNGNGQDNTLTNWTNGNPFTPVVDAASFDNNYVFQLDSSGNIYKVNTTNGTFDTSFGTNGVVNTGSNTSFGIGYDSNTNRIGIGQFDGTDMTFGTYDVGTDTLSWNNDFTFDDTQYGTPTGLDLARVGNSDRMLVGTRDGPSINPSNPSAPERNFILDMDLDSGLIGQYGTITGADNKLQDVHYLDEKLALAFQDGTTGGIQVMDNFGAIPEPKYAVLGAGLAALGYTMSRRRQSKDAITGEKTTLPKGPTYDI